MRQPILTPHPLSSGRTDLFKRLWFSPLARLRGGGEGEALGFTRFLIRKTKPSPLTPLPQAGEGNKSASPLIPSNLRELNPVLLNNSHTLRNSTSSLSLSHCSILLAMSISDM